MSGARPEKIAALDAASRLDEAKAVGGAQYQARSDTASKAMSYLDNAARFGRNMPSTGIATASLADSQGAQAQSGYGALTSAAAAPAQAASPLFNSAVSSNSSAGSLFGNAAGLDYTGSLMNSNYTLGALGGAAKLYGMQNPYGIGSSKKIKHRGGKADGRAASKAIEATPAENWRYRKGQGDGNPKARIGPMAEDLAKVAPQVSDGKTVDGISLMGLHHSAIGNHAQRLKRIEHSLSLAEAATGRSRYRWRDEHRPDGALLGTHDGGRRRHHAVLNGSTCAPSRRRSR